MNAQDSQAEIFDVFLCHNGEDKPAVREVAKKLAEKKIKPWLDEEQIRPGTSWQSVLGEQIKKINSAAVFVGNSGIGPWQDEEIQALLSQFMKRKCPVIPTVLANATKTPELSWTLQNRHWVDFRVIEPDPLKQLVWGITGVKPAQQSQSSNNPPVSTQADDVQRLVPPKKKVVIEIELIGKDVEEFSAEESDKIRTEIRSRLKLSEVRVTQVVAGSVRMRLEVKPEDADKIYAATENGQLAALGISKTRLYPSIAVPPDGEERSQLLILLNRVNETWVEGILKSSLQDEVLISLGKEPMNEAVEQPRKHVVEFASQRNEALLKDRNIDTIFDATGSLLILGEPGSGKTTTLLELASNLIVRAKAHPKERVPVVLNLSSWKKKQSLADWMAGELSQKYQVPFKIARSWLQKDYLVPLLDGLDELSTAVQPDCVAAINDFIDERDPSGIIVCCRLVEYQWLPKRLKLNGAIRLESLGSEEVSNYLAKGGSKLAALREAVNTDPVLQELAQTPLMLSVMSLAFQGSGDNELVMKKGSSLEDRRKQIFRLYIGQMFQRKETISPMFPKEKVIGWLSWLARKMRKRSQSVLLVEGLQPSWLDTKAQRVAYGTVVASSIGVSLFVIFGLIGTISEHLSEGLIVGLIIGLTILVAVGLGCWRKSLLENGTMSGSIGGLIAGLIFGIIFGLNGEIIFGLNGGEIDSLLGLQDVNLGEFGELIHGLVVGLIVVLFVGPIFGLIGGLGVGPLNDITLVEKMSWEWNQFWERMISNLKFFSIGGILVGGVLGALAGSILTPIAALIESHDDVPPIQLVLALAMAAAIGAFLGTVPGFILGLIAALPIWFVSGLVGGVTDTLKADKVSPNQGIKLSRKNALIASIIICLIVGLPVGLLSLLSGGLLKAVSLGLLAGMIGGLIGGLSRGGSAFIKHYALRLILWLSGCTPFKFIKFLDHSAKLILLKKVGGGYIFIHRMLLDYFAEMTPAKTGKI